MAPLEYVLLTLSQCRKQLGDDCQLTDPELEQLRENLYGLAHVISDAFFEQHERLTEGRGAEFSEDPTRWPDLVANARFEQFAGGFELGERDALVERAAIMEFDGGLDRRSAEEATIISFRGEHPRRN